MHLRSLKKRQTQKLTSRWHPADWLAMSQLIHGAALTLAMPEDEPVLDAVMYVVEVDAVTLSEPEVVSEDEPDTVT